MTPSTSTPAANVAPVAIIGDSYVSASRWTAIAGDELAASPAPISASVRGEGGSGYVKRGSKGGVFAEHARRP